jgi:hypothetical protein
MLAAAALFATYRSARRRSALLAGIFGAGLMARLIIGFGLFAISMFDLPVLKGLHSGGGFWTLAIDARWYFEHAATAARLGLQTIPDAAPSPAYLRVSAVWLDLAGVSPASTVLFNLLCYAGVALVIVATCRSYVGATLALLSITGDPALVMIGTQSLKDPFCILLIALALAGMRVWCDGLEQGAWHQRRRSIAGLLLTALAVFELTGVRAYAGWFLPFAAVAAGTAAVTGSTGRRWKVATAYCVLVMAICGAFVQGAGAYYPYYESLVLRTLHDPTAPMVDLDQARAAFDAARGGTSFTSDSPSEASAFELRTHANVSPSMKTRGARFLLGCLVMFMPISILQALSVVTFTGGRGMLFLTDIDTVFIDLTLAGSVVILARTRIGRSSLPLLICGIVFAVLITVGLAYTVTNFGTLFRLRLMAIAPLWVLPALVSGASRSTPKPVL